jgi:hypothetical protein
LVKEFTETKGRKKQRFIRMPLKGVKMVGGEEKEQGAGRQG